MTQDTINNPAGTRGFAFLEYAAADPNTLRALFRQMGFVHYGQHRVRRVEWWRQNDIHFLINMEPDSFSATFAQTHGPSVCGMGFFVNDATHALAHCLAEKADVAETFDSDWHEHDDCETLVGIGDSRLYLVTKTDNPLTFFEHHFERVPGVTEEQATPSMGLTFIDHVTHNVFQGNMDRWADFYTRLFNFRQIRYFDIQGKQSGLYSRAMGSPCGNIIIPINESADDHSQIAEYLSVYNGEGIQHIAMHTDDIYQTVEVLRANDLSFMDTPDTYYEKVDSRLPDHGEPLERMQSNRILIDGEGGKKGKRLLQIFTNTVIGPIFFEIIQRKGDEGFGEGNFSALFESIELDQIRRGVLQEQQS